MIIPIKTTLNNYFGILLQTLHPLLNLTPLEESVAAKIMLLHFTNKDKVSEEQFEQLILSSNVTKSIRESLPTEITEEEFAEIIVTLREKRILIDSKVSPRLTQLYPAMEDTEIGYKIVLDLDG